MRVYVVCGGVAARRVEKEVQNVSTTILQVTRVCMGPDYRGKPGDMVADHLRGLLPGDDVREVIMTTNWWTCEQGHEWNNGNDDEECPVCEQAARQSRYEAAEEWKREQIKDAQREDLGLDPREYAYWDRLM